MNRFGQFSIASLLLLFTVMASLYAFRHLAFEEGLITRRLPLLYALVMATYVRVSFVGSTSMTRLFVGFVLGGLIVVVATLVLRADFLNLIAFPENEKYWKWLRDRPHLSIVIVEEFFVGGVLTAILLAALPSMERAQKKPRG